MSDQPETAGDMGVSSERVGPTGPGQTGTDGVRDPGCPAAGAVGRWRGAEPRRPAAQGRLPEAAPRPRRQAVHAQARVAGQAQV